MWGLPGPGLEPVSPALAGRVLTTAPPGKPEDAILEKEYLGDKEPVEIKNRIVEIKNSIEELEDKVKEIFQKWSQNGK